MGLTHVLAPDIFQAEKIVNKWQVTYVPQFTMWTPAYIPIENKWDVQSMQFSCILRHYTHRNTQKNDAVGT